MGPKIGGRKEKLAAKAAQLEAQRKEKEEREERERQEMERQRQLEIARQERREREKVEMKEKQIRDKVLKETCDDFTRLHLMNLEDKMMKREEEEWKRYIKCERLPLLNNIPNINTYLYLWHDTEETGRMEYVFEKNESMLDILELLEDYIDDPLDENLRTINNYIEVRDKYRQEIRNKLDTACFQLIRTIHKSFSKINYWESEFNKSSTNVKLWMWTWQMRTITSLSSALPVKVFPSISVKLPTSVAKKLLILRIMYTTYDHYSDNSTSWSEPENPLQHNLYQENIIWYEKKVEIIKDNYEMYLSKEEIPYWYNFEDEDSEKKEMYTEEETDETNDKTTSSPVVEIQELEQIMNKKSEEISMKTDEENSDNYQSSLSSTLTDTESESCLSPSRLSKRNRFRNKLPPKNTEELSDSESDDEDLKELRETSGRKVVDWVNQSQSMNVLDETFILTTILPKPDRPQGIRTLKDLLDTVKPRRRLDTLPMSKEIRTQLYKMLRRTTSKIKKKISTEHEEIEKPYKDLSTMIKEYKNEEMKNYKKTLTVQLPDNHVNLRKFIIIGGIYHIDLLHQVPQPYKHKNGTITQLQYGEYCLRKEDFFFKYVPPVVTETEEDDEEDRKKPVDDDIGKLICIDIQLSDTVLWFENPIPVIWNPQGQSWTTQDIYEVKFNEEKQLISFRIGRTAPIGLAANRFYNLPYQTWEIRPSDWKTSKSIVFSLTASTVTVEYLLEKDKVQLNSIQNATSGALDGILGIPFHPNKLIRIMKQAGLDLFPGWDSYLYIEGNSAKNKAFEDHVYLCMAKFAGAYQYTWSRWNLPGGREKIVFQLKEAKQTKDQMVNYSMMVTTPERASIVACTEVSPTFSEEPAEDIGFHPDLNSLLMHISTYKALRKVHKTQTDIMFTLYYMLLHSKILSYS